MALIPLSKPYVQGHCSEDSARRMVRRDRDSMRPVSVNDLRPYATAQSCNPRHLDERTEMGDTRVRAVIISRLGSWTDAILYRGDDDGGQIITIERISRLWSGSFQYRLLIVSETEYVNFDQAQLEWDELVERRGADYSRSGSEAYTYLRDNVTLQQNDHGRYMYSSLWRPIRMDDVDEILEGQNGWLTSGTNTLMNVD